MALMSQVGLEFVARNRATAVMSSFRNSIGGVTRHLFSLKSAILGVAGVGGFGYMIRQQMKSIDQLAKMSDELQISTRALSGWEHASKISGTSIETLHSGLSIFVRRLGEAKAGIGEGRRGLEMLGLTAQQLIDMGMERAFERVADDIGKLATSAEQAGAAYNLFGRQGVQLLNLFQQRGEGIRRLREEADKLGLTFSRFDAAKVEAANDALTRARAVMTGLFRTATIEISPFIEAAASSFAAWATSGEGVGERLTNVFEQVALSIVNVAAETEKLIIKLKHLTSPLEYIAAATAANKVTLERYQRESGQMLSRWDNPVLEPGVLRNRALYERILQEERQRRGLEPSIDAESRIRKIFENIRAPKWGPVVQQVLKDNQRALQEQAAANASLQAEVVKTAGIVRDAGVVEAANLRDRMTGMFEYYEQMKLRAADAYGVALEYSAAYSRQVQDDFVRMWDPFIDGTKSAKEAMLDFFRDMLLNLAKAQAQMAMMRLWDRAIGPTFGGVSQTLFGIPATLFHQGGLVGEVAASRIVPAAAFAGAPRLHEGLGADEFPAILQRGERVLPAGGGQPVINYNVTIKALDSQDVQKALWRERNFLGDIALVNRRANHPSRRTED